MCIYRIGEMADMLGVSSETLRFYERKGLIRPVERNKPISPLFDLGTAYAALRANL